MARTRRARPRRIKGLPGVRLPLPRKPHQRHEDKRLKPPKHRKPPGTGEPQE